MVDKADVHNLANRAGASLSDLGLRPLTRVVVGDGHDRPPVFLEEWDELLVVSALVLRGVQNIFCIVGTGLPRERVVAHDRHVRVGSVAQRHNVLHDCTDRALAHAPADVEDHEVPRLTLVLDDRLVCADRRTLPVQLVQMLERHLPLLGGKTVQHTAQLLSDLGDALSDGHLQILPELGQDISLSDVRHEARTLSLNPDVIGDDCIDVVLQFLRVFSVHQRVDDARPEQRADQHAQVRVRHVVRLGEEQGGLDVGKELSERAPSCLLPRNELEELETLLEFAR